MVVTIRRNWDSDNNNEIDASVVQSGAGSPLTTKGDIYTYDTVNQRLPVGTDGQILSANSATATGLEWIANTGGGGGGGFGALIGDNAATSFIVNHGLGTRDVVVEVYRNSGLYDKVYPEIQHTDVNNVTLDFTTTTPTLNEFAVFITSGGGGGGESGARVTMSSNLNIPDNTAITVGFDQEDFDTDDYHDNVTNNTRLTVPEDGLYIVAANFEFASNTTGDRAANILINGTTTTAILRVPPANTFNTRLPLSSIVQLSSGDYLEFIVFQNSGVALNLNAANTWFAISKFGGSGGSLGGRELLTANRTYYVNDTLGSDSNDGLSTGAGAFQTIQRGVDELASVDVGSSALTHTLQLEGNFTLTSRVTLGGLVGSAIVEIVGDTVTPSNVTITDNSSDSTFVSSSATSNWTIKGVTIVDAATCINSSNGATIIIEDCRFEDFTTRVFVASNSGNIRCDGDIFNESALGSDLAFSDRFGVVQFEADIEFGATSTFSSAIFRPRFSAFMRVNNATFSGTTGAGLGDSCRVEQFSILDTASGSTVGLPGNGTNSGSGGAIV